MKLKKFQNREELEKFYLNKVDNLAEKERSKYITPGSGQATTYQLKYEEALAGGGPILKEEALMLNIELEEVVDSVLYARNAWVKVGAKIEGVRLKGKNEIRNAADASEMHSIVQGLNFSGNQET